MEQRTKDFWKLEWGCQMIDMENGYFLARFYKREDYFHVLESGPWIVMGHYLTVTKWKPNFRSSDGHVQTTLVWIHLPELPMELFDEEVLYAIGNAIGRTTKVDNTTLQIRRGRYARVCVEVDHAKPLVPFITVLGRHQRVEYEGLHLICFGCGKYGHQADNCPLSVATQPPPVAAPRQNAEDAIGFGPWMMPKYGRRRPPKSSAGRPQPPIGNVVADSSKTLTEDIVPVEAHGEQDPAVGPIGEDARPVPRGTSTNPGVALVAQKKKQAQSHFSVLDDLEQEVDLEQNLENLKKQIQFIPGSGRRTSEELAHERRGPKTARQKGKAPAGASGKDGPTSSLSLRKAPTGTGPDPPRALLREVSNSPPGPTLASPEKGAGATANKGKGVAGPHQLAVSSHASSNSKARHAEVEQPPVPL